MHCLQDWSENTTRMNLTVVVHNAQLPKVQGSGHSFATDFLYNL